MRTKAEARQSRWPRGMTEPEAASYVGMGATKFRELVADGRMPRPRLLAGMRRWDVDDLDAAFKAMPIEGEESSWADVLQRQEQA
jgi:excisionase family DNA binding protein